MRRTYPAAVALVFALAIAGCDRQSESPEVQPAGTPVVTSTQSNPPVPKAPDVAAEEATTDLDSVDQVLREIQGDLASADAPLPDAD